MVGDVRAQFGLTNEQQEILRLVVQGQTRLGISRALGLSRSTVDKRLAETYEKLGAASRLDAIDILGLEAPEVLRAWETSGTQV